MKKLMYKSTYQSGFMSVWILGLLIVGIAAGTLLVQNGVNFLPKAAGKTTACDGQTLSGQSAQSRADFLAVYGANATEEWVAEHEEELIAKGIPCKDPGGYAPGIGTGANANKASQPVVTADSSQACSKDQEKAKEIETSFKDAKVANNLVRFYAIFNGIPNMCVPADLGVQPVEEIDDKRLLLCSGEAPKDNSEKLPDLVWRLADIKNKKLIPVPGKSDPDRYTLKEGFKNLGTARKAAGLPEKEKEE